MRRFAAGVVVAGVAIVLSAVFPLPGERVDPPLTTAQTLLYEYEVLAGVQPGYEGPAAAEDAASRYFTSPP